jgi:hypothetical protein
MPCVTFRNVLVSYGTELLAPSFSQLLCWRYALFSMSWTACSVFSQPPSISGSRIVHPQYENAFPNSRDVGPPPGGGPGLLIPMCSHLHSTHGDRLSVCDARNTTALAVYCFIVTCVTLRGYCGCPLPWPLVFMEVSYTDLWWGRGGGGEFVHVAHDVTGKPNSVFSIRVPALVLSLGILTQNFSRPSCNNC